MSDPLSIIAGVVGLLGTAYQVGAELKKFHDGVVIIESTIEGLLQDVAGLTNVLESMQETFENITAEFGTTGNVASHLRNVARSLADGKEILGQLEALLRGVNKPKRFLDGPRKRLRLNSATDQMASYRQHINSYSQALQLSMQIMLFQNQMHHQRSTDQLLPGLDNLNQEVRRVAIEMNQRIESLQETKATSNNESQVIAMVNLRDCVKSAASIVSSASTMIASKQSASSEIAASDFGDVFPVDDNVMIQRWMETRTAYDDEDHRSPFTPKSMASIADFDDSNSEADSDVDLEREMDEVLLNTANITFAEGDLMAAERLFRNCLSRLLNRPRTLQPANGSKAVVMEVEILQKLSDLYTQQRHWGEARQVITQKLVVQSRIFGKHDNLVLHDIARLASLAALDGAFVEAQLQARRALKGYKKVKDNQGIESCLVLLVSVCKRDGKHAEHEAYSAMLAAHRNKPLVMQEKSQLHVGLAQRSRSADARSTLPSARRIMTKTTKHIPLTNNETNSVLLPGSGARRTLSASRLRSSVEDELTSSDDELSLRQKDVEGQDFHKGMDQRAFDSSISTSATAGQNQRPGHEIVPPIRTDTFDSQAMWEDEVLDISVEAAQIRAKARSRLGVTGGEGRAEAAST
nr:hypothetical protein CFP56_30067 [Quercus suber]